jgi:hypothetical protein
MVVRTAPHDWCCVWHRILYRRADSPMHVRTGAAVHACFRREAVRTDEISGFLRYRDTGCSNSSRDSSFELFQCMHAE